MFDMPFILHSPLALLGLLSLFIPLGIHLLSKARPHVIAFAHIAFIKATTTPVLRQLRLTQLTLLALRLLMLLLATLILAQVYWQNTNLSVTSHILLTEDWLVHATDTEKQSLVDLAHNSDLVLLGTKNSILSKAELAQWPTNKLQIPVFNMWSKVADHVAEVPAGSTVSVYTTNRLKQFIGAKIPLTEQVEWHVKTIAVANVPQQYSLNIRVIYDDSSESLLANLRGAFEVIDNHEKLTLNVDYINNINSKYDSEHLLNFDKIIDISQQELVQQQPAFDTLRQPKHISHSELKNSKQADFVLTLARLLFSSQSQTWWLENTRLSRAQITEFSDQKPNQEPTKKTTPSTPLHVWLILILVATFISERMLSEWPKSRPKYAVGK